MFIETHEDESIALTFIKSANVQAFPCGRRRSQEIDIDGNKDTTNDRYYIPFDPEARLNTEANNRKHSSLNGFTQTYLKEWDETKELLSLALEGYLFNISLANNYVSTNDFGSAVAESVGDATANKIYANIRIEDVHLYSGHQDYMTGILRNQSKPVDGGLDTPETSLDLLKDTLVGSTNLDELENFENYYFSGLSFSTIPLTGDTEAPRSSVPYSFKRGTPPADVTQQLVSLCILEKGDDGWKIHQPALLPFIEHDVTEDSVVMGETHVRENLTVDKDTTVTNNFTVTDKVEVTTETTKVKNKLVVENDVEVLNNKITTKDLTSTDTILANNIGTSTSKVTKITARDADIETLSGDDIQQKVKVEGDDVVKVTEDYYDVPVIFVREITTGGKTEHQLQITRVNSIHINKPIEAIYTNEYEEDASGNRRYYSLSPIFDNTGYVVNGGLYLSIVGIEDYYVDNRGVTKITNPVFIQGGTSYNAYFMSGPNVFSSIEFALNKDCNQLTVYDSSNWSFTLAKYN